MNFLRIIIYLFIPFILSCSGGLPLANAPNTNDSRDQLAVLAFSTSLIRPQELFISYSKRAGRASIIDPINKVETWSIQQPNYKFAVSHSNFEQVSLISNFSLFVHTSDASKKFSLQFQSSHISYASDVLTFAFASIDGDKIHVIKSLGNGQWQEETFAIPWTVDLMSQHKLVSLYKNDGSELIVFNPTELAYWRLQSSDTNTHLSAVDSFCVGKSENSTLGAAYYLKQDNENNILFVATDKGNIISINLTENCSDIPNSPAISLGDTSPIYSINLLGNNEMIVSQENQQISHLTYDINGIVNLQSEYDSHCKTPLNTLSLSNNNLLISCVKRDDGIINEDSIFYQLIDVSTNQLINSFHPVDTFAGIGIDSENLIMYRMRESALGILETINLQTSESTLTKGLYLDNLLE